MGLWTFIRLERNYFSPQFKCILKGAKEHELTYKGSTSIKAPTDRLLRSTSLEIGLEKASEERCEAIKQEYPDLCSFFESLNGCTFLPTKEQLEKLWEENAKEVYPDFNEFVAFLSGIGMAKWREKESRYGFADIYVYGFKMVRTGAK